MTDGVELAAEEVNVASWKIAVLTNAGCDPVMAGLLASAGVDHHKAVEMFEQGCGWDTIVKILA